MTLMEKATEKAKADRKAAAEAATTRRQDRIAKVERITSEYFGVTVLYTGVEEIVEEKIHGSYQSLSGRTVLPVLSKREIFTVNNEVKMTHSSGSGGYYGVAGDGRVTELVMPCAKKCGRQVHSETVHIWRDDTGEESLVKAIANALERPKACAFCEAAEKAATCPTCHRPLGEAT